jgi:hypothetical protein
MNLIRCSPNLVIDLDSVVALEVKPGTVVVYTKGAHKFTVHDNVVVKKIEKAFRNAAKADPTGGDKGPKKGLFNRLFSALR